MTARQRVVLGIVVLALAKQVGQNPDSVSSLVAFVAAVLLFAAMEQYRGLGRSLRRQRRRSRGVYQRAPIPAAVRRRVYARDHHTCQYCGRGEGRGVQLVIDHIYPVARGGTNDIRNLITACAACNAAKGARVLGDEAAMRRFERERIIRGRELDREWERAQRRGCSSLLPVEFLFVGATGVVAFN